MSTNTVDPSVSSASPTPRRTQSQRTEHMRARLLHAAVDALVELGYARASTQEISRRAGVSRGAQLHHFPSKEQLVVAAVEHLVELRLQEISAIGDVPVDQAVDLLVDTFSGPVFHAALELWVAARTDPALHAAMVPLERRVNDAIAVGSAEVFGGAVSPEAIELSVELARGLGVSAIFRTPAAESALRERLLPIWKALVITS